MSRLLPTRPRTGALVHLADLAARVGEVATNSSGSSSSGGSAGSDPAIAGVSLDSRTVVSGDLYAALPGRVTHGAKFAGQARDRGAVAVLTDDTGATILAASGIDLPAIVVADPRAVLGGLAAAVYGDPADRLRVIGITGTNGKTTTAYLIESALRSIAGDPARTGLIGTVETRVGRQRLASVRTTPEAPELHEIFAVMRERGVESAVMEVSSHALAQHRVDGVVFDLAVFTNLSQDHLDFHADMEDYFAAKASLFTPAHARSGVVCVDDQWGGRLAGQASIPLITVGVSPGRTGPAPGRSATPDWRITMPAAPMGPFLVTGPHGTIHLRAQLPGDFNVVNTALAAVTLVQAGFRIEQVEQAMAAPAKVPGRMELVAREPHRPGDPRCVVDFAHTAEAVDAALGALRATTAGRLIAVLGAGGDRDRGKRTAMGAAAARWADIVVVTDDNPRSEDPAGIRDAVLAGVRDVTAGGGRSTVVRSSGAGRGADIAEAIALSRADADPAQDTVVVLGKGHETSQTIGEVTCHFDDREAVLAALDGRPYRPTRPAVDS